MSEEKQKDRNNDAVIEINSVSKAFAARAVLKSINLNVTQSQSVCLRGVNGAGKSILLRIVAGQSASFGLSILGTAMLAALLIHNQSYL